MTSTRLRALKFPARRMENLRDWLARRRTALAASVAQPVR
jgi:hypothetical protein